jgi:hypothetical protein
MYIYTFIFNCIYVHICIYMYTYIYTGYEVQELSKDEEFEEIYNDLCISTEGQFNLIIDIDNISVEHILQSEYIENTPKIIILTTLLTWCGGSSTYVVKNPTYDFSTRVPLYRCGMFWLFVVGLFCLSSIICMLTLLCLWLVCIHM